MSMSQIPHFVCFRWGTLYPAVYVERLYRSVFRVKAGALPHVWDDLLKADYESLTQELGGEREQKWLDWYFPSGKVALYPPGRVVSYKYHCDAMGAKPFGKRLAHWGVTSAVWGRAKLPEPARVVCFHGKPDMEDVVDGRWGWWRWAPFIREFWEAN